jgi:hypothetical protein
MASYLRFGGVYRGGLRVLASRGCPYSCAYCSVSAIRGAVPGCYYRTRSAASVVDEMQLMFQRYRPLGARYVNFADATFGHHRGQLEELVQELTRRGLQRQIPWTCSTHPRVIDERWARRCRQGGCFQVSVGLESGDARVRQQVLGKRVTDAELRRALASLDRAGLLVVASVMLCAPTETWRSLLRTLVLVLRANPTRTLFSHYFPLPLSELAGRQGLPYHWPANAFPSDVFSRPHPRLNRCGRTLGLASRALSSLYKAGSFLGRGLALRGPRFLTDVAGYALSEARAGRARRSRGRLLPALWVHTVAEYTFQRALEGRP